MAWANSLFQRRKVEFAFFLRKLSRNAGKTVRIWSEVEQSVQNMEGSSEALSELSMAAQEPPRAILRLLRDVDGGASPESESQLALAVLCKLLRARPARVRNPADVLRRIRSIGELTEDDEAEFDGLIEIYDLARVGVHGSVADAQNEIERYGEQYADRLRGIALPW